MIWACDVKVGGLCRTESNVNESALTTHKNVAKLNRKNNIYYAFKVTVG